MSQLKAIFAMSLIIFSGSSAFATLLQYTCGNYIYQTSTSTHGQSSLHDHDESVSLGVQLHRIRMGDTSKNVDFLKLERRPNRNGKLVLAINGFENICEHVRSY